MCSDLAFNALIFNDWSSSVSRVYAPQDASDGVTAASTALAQLGPMLAPKCMVVVMGASAESADGEEKTPDFPSRDSEQQARAAEDVKSKPIDSKEWEVALGPNTTVRNHHWPSCDGLYVPEICGRCLSDTSCQPSCARGRPRSS